MLHLANNASLIADIDRILAPEDVPTERDILLSIQPTTGIVHTTIKKRGFTVTLVDVGGRLSQRRKWTQCLIEASAVIMCMSLADYDRFVRWRTAEGHLVT